MTTQLPSLWHRNFAWSLMGDQASLLCLRPLSSPCLYPVHVQGVLLPGSTSLLSFISDGDVFPNPSFQRTLQVGPTLTLWGNVSLSNGQLAPECVHAVVQQQRFRDYGKSQYTASARFHCTLMSLSQYQQTRLLSRVRWDLCLWEAIWPLPNALQAEEPLLPL